jgi:hypothetical protein
MEQINSAGSSGGGGGGSTVDRELVVETYLCTTAFTGASVNDTITMTQVIDVTGSPFSVGTIWRNQTTAADLSGAPSAANITLVASNALTNAQLRAQDVNTGVPNISISGTVASGAISSILTLSGRAGFGVVIAGLTGSCTVEATIDGSRWDAISSAPLQGGARAQSITTNGAYEGISAGVQAIRINAAGSSSTVTFALLATNNSRIIRVWSTNAANLLTSSWLMDGSGNAISSTAGALDVNLKSGGFATAAAQGTGNTSLATIASAAGSAIAQEGTDSTGVTQLTGGVGIRGWLSGIFSKLSGVLSTSIDKVAGATISGGRLPVFSRNGTNSIADACISLANFAVIGSLASGDILMADGNAVAANYVTLSLDPLSANTESRIEYNATFSMPYRASLGLSMSQRVLGQEFSVEFVDTGTLQTAFTPKTISSIQQATTTLTVTTSANHGLVAGQTIAIDGCVDPRFNYPALVVASTPALNQFTCTAGPAGTIPSVTAGPFTSGTVYARSRLGRANDGTSLIFENATATSASVYVRSEGGDALPGGTVLGNHSDTTQSTASVQAVNAQGVNAFQPTTKFELIADPDNIQWLNKTVDGVAVQGQIRKREQVIPNPTATYKWRLRGNSNAGLTRPVGQISTASKAGSTTATVTVTNHGLTSSDLVVIYGSRDTTNFANVTSATAITVVDANTFTLTWGASVTATSYGGFVSRVNGGNVQQGVSTIVAQSISRTSNIVTVIGSATWTGALIGELVNLIGVRDTNTGASLGLDGVYQVNNINTTTLTLVPVSGYAPTGADVTSTNCGGTFIKRTDLRVHFARVFQYDRFVTEVIGSNSRAAGDVAQSLPVAVTVLPTLATVTSLSQIAASVPLMSASNGSTNKALGISMTNAVTQTDVSAVAFAGAGRVNGTVIASAQGGGAVISAEINVSALTLGAATSVIPILQESRGGTNYEDIWVGDPITATGIVSTPALMVAGRRRWCFHSVGGTSTTVTVTITTLELFGNYPLLRQFRDAYSATNPFATVFNSATLAASTFVLATLNSATTPFIVEGLKALTFHIDLTGAPTVTTQPVVVVEFSKNGTTWWTSAVTMTAAGNGLYTADVQNKVARFARLKVQTAAAYSAGSYTISNIGVDGLA